MKRLVCSKCGSKDVQVLAWVSTTTYEFEGVVDESHIEHPEMNFCTVCMEHVTLEEVDVEPSPFDEELHNAENRNEDERLDDDV